MKKSETLLLRAETIRALTTSDLRTIAGGEPKSGNAMICVSRNCTAPGTDACTGSLVTFRANSNCGCTED